MDMSNIPVGEIVASNIDLSPINIAIEQRASALSEQMNDDAAKQFLSDMSSYQCNVNGEGESVKFKTSIKESYLINYLKSHDMPVAGGDNGTAHNVDGSTYKSKVNPSLYGTPLPWYELPTIDGEEEVNHLISIMAPDATQDGINRSIGEIKEALIPSIKETIVNAIGGGLN